MPESLEFLWDLAKLSRDLNWHVRKGQELLFKEIVTDTRTIAQEDKQKREGRGKLFVAIPGTRYDGHTFIPEAIQKGIEGIIVHQSWQGEVPPHITVIRVPDPRRALGELAHDKVKHYTGTVIAITGSSGKTTTKFLLHRILGEGYAAPGNLNNDIGVPLSVFQAPLKERFWIFELGMNAPGEIAYLARILKPRAALLLPAGSAHLGLLGSRSAILRAKAELLTAYPPQLAILGDRRYLHYLSPSTRAILVLKDRRSRQRMEEGKGTFSPPFFIRKVDVRFPKGTFVCVSHGKKNIHFFLSLIGEAFALPIAMSCAASLTLTGKVSVTELNLPEHEGRMKLHPLRDRWVVDDSYNASPESYTAFLRTMRQIQKQTGLTLALLLGEMKELGRFSLSLHRNIARIVKTLPISWLGALGEDLKQALILENVPFLPFTEPRDAVQKAWEVLPPEGILGLKGAHATGIYEAFREFRKEYLCSLL